MPKNLLLLSYYFPPGNIIGAVRPYQIARHFQQLGWNVNVISAQDSSVSDDYDADISNLVVNRIAAPKLLAWLTKPHAGGDGTSARIMTFALRCLRFLIRSLLFPEHFVLIKRLYLREAHRLAAQVSFDLVISSAFPFAMHGVAREFAARHSVPWIADNRDLWAASPYRKLIFPRRGLDGRYEKSVLGKAQLVIGVTQGMVDYYRSKYDFEKTLLVMNGHSGVHTARDVGVADARADLTCLEIVYGGILYGDVRDPSPLLKAIDSDPKLKKWVKVSFFGADRARVSTLQTTYPDCLIEQHERVSKAEISRRFQAATVLLVILGTSDFEKIVLPGKFFEYLGYGKPVLAIASEQSELAALIEAHGVGLATNDPVRIAAYLRRLLDGELPLSVQPPEELSSANQMSLLSRAAVAIQEEGAL